MQCDICGKKQATVHLTEIIDDQMTELHLCEACAREKGAQMDKHFGLPDLLAGLADAGGALEPKVELKLKCPKCGMGYQDFRATGQLGCAECYKAFKKNLLPLLKRIHGSTQYFGKAPMAAAVINGRPQTARSKAIAATHELQDFKIKLQKAVQAEEFEEAARLRDRIKELEKEQD